jgi:hypothetical protein
VRSAAWKRPNTRHARGVALDNEESDDGNAVETCFADEGIFIFATAIFFFSLVRKADVKGYT